MGGLLTLLLAAAPASAAYEYESGWGGPASTLRPWGVAVDQVVGGVYVSDHVNHRIHRFDRLGNPREVLGRHGTGPLQFDSPAGIMVDGPSGALFVADRANNRVHRIWARHGPPWSSHWGEEGAGAGQFRSPRAVATDWVRHVYVADHDNNRVQRFDFEGGFLGQWGGAGSAAGKFSGPVGIAVNEFTGVVYVADAGNDRIQRFGPTGAFLGEWGRPGTSDGEFLTPLAIAVNGRRGEVLVSDQGNKRVQRFTLDGQFLGKFGRAGSGAGEFRAPTGLAVNRESGELYVADAVTHRVQRFRQVGPTTRVVSGPKRRTTSRKARFRFRSSAPNATFECSLIGTRAPIRLKRWRPCANPKRYGYLRIGRKVLRVRSIDYEGDTGPFTRYRWKVTRR